jgi:hypothetical protein
MGARGSAAKDGKVSRSPGRTKGRRSRRAIPASADRIAQVAGVSEGQRLDADADREGVDLATGLREPNSSIISTVEIYRRLRWKAEAALEKLVEAPGVPANVRAAAVRTALELVGAIGSRAKDQRDQEDRADDLDPEQLSIEDIDREIKATGRV